MFDASNRKSAGRDASLLSMGSASAPQPTPRADSLLSMAGSSSPADDAQERHRLARARREAMPAPSFDARSAAAAYTGEPASPTKPAKRSLGGWFDRLFHRPADTAQVYQPEATHYAPEPVAREWDAEPAPDMDARGGGGDRRQGAGPPDSKDDQYWQPLIDPFKVIGGVIRSRWLIVGMGIAGAVLGVIIAMQTPKVYEAYTELLVDPRDLKLVDRELTTTGLPSDATLALVENQARVLTSSTVLNKVVDKLNLTDDPEFNGTAGGGIGLGSAISFLRSLFSRQDAAVDESRKRSLAVEHLGKSLTVERGGKTFIIVITVKTQDPEKSALIGNTMSEVFMQTSGELQAGTAGRATDELTARLDTLRGEVEQAERAVANFKAEHDIVDPQGRLITDDEIVKVNDQLSVAKARTIELSAKAANTRGVTAAAAANGALPEELSSPLMIELRSQYASVKQEADRVGVRLGPRHPTRIAADAQVAGALDSIAIELRRINSSLQVELQRAVEQEQNLAARLAQLKARQGGIGGDLVTLRELDREATAKRAVYEAFLLRARETAEQRDINAANVTVISPAYAPLDPTGPGRSTIVAGGLILGLLFGVGIGAVRGGWESLRENMAARPRRRRWLGGSSASGKGGNDKPPQPTPPGNRAAPKDRSVKDEGEKMGLFNMLRRASAPREAAQPQPAAYAPPGYAGGAPAYGQPGGYAPPAYAPPPAYGMAGHVPPTAPVAPAYAAQPSYAPPPAYPPAMDMHGRQPLGWEPVQHAPAGYAAAAHAPMHPGWAPPAPQPAYPAAHAMPPQPAPQAYVQTQQPAQPGWPGAPAWTGAPHGGQHFAPQPVYYAAPAYVAVQEPAAAPMRRPAAEPVRDADPLPLSAMEEIRESLREFREVVEGLADTRQRRRYS